jgi:hypothetical protein
MEKRDVIIGIAFGGVVCTAGIVFGPVIPAGTLAATILTGGLGALSLLVLARRHNPGSVAVGATSTLVIGGYGLAAGIISGPPAALALALMGGIVLVAAQVLRPIWAAERPPAAEAAP